MSKAFLCGLTLSLWHSGKRHKSTVAPHPSLRKKKNLKSLLCTFAKLDNLILNEKLYGIIEGAVGKEMRRSVLNELCDMEYFTQLQGISALIS